MPETQEIKTVYIAVDDLNPYDRNARKHGTDDVQAIVESIKEFGFNDPIGVWGDKNTIVEGHGRLLAAKLLGMQYVPCIRLDHLTDEQRRGYALAHNKTAELSRWDDGMLDIELGDITDIDMSLFGFDIAEDDAPTEVVEDDVPEEAETRCKTGDIWQLGEHRLMCGDSTDANSLDILMDGVKADIAFASPPYNAGFGANITKDNGRSKYTNGDDDNMSTDDYERFLSSYIDNVSRCCLYNFVNIQMLANNKKALFNVVCERISRLADVIVWDKTRSQPQLAVNVLNSEFEFVFCFSEKGNRHIGTLPFHGTQKNIVHISPSHNEYADIHNAVFPLALPAHFIETFAKETVLDVFGGTGTTLIACEQLNRRCYMMELDPHYCDVILQRWENFTGRKAELINGETS